MKIEKVSLVDRPSDTELEASLVQGKDATIVISDPEGVVSGIRGSRVVVKVDVTSVGRVSGQSRQRGFMGHVRRGPGNHVFVEGVINDDEDEGWVAVVHDREPSIQLMPQG